MHAITHQDHPVQSKNGVVKKKEREGKKGKKNKLNDRSEKKEKRGFPAEE